LGLGAGETIHIVPISRTVKAAQNVVFGGVVKKLELAPWFRGKFKATLDYVEFPGKNIKIVGGASTDASALGLNVFSAIIDEGNFMGAVKSAHAQMSAGGKTYDRAQMIYDALVRRVKSRYQRSGVKGMIFLVSSKRATDDFTERRIREHIKNKTTAGVFVRDYATWNVKPEAFANQEWYRCSVSSSEGRCRILEDEEKPPADALVFTFPEDYLSEFQRDPAGCFTGDTKISLLDGREVAIADLVDEEEFWTYSFFPDGRFYPGRGHSARLVKKDAPIVEVELDNGERIRCTPDHRFMLRNGSYLPAMALRLGTSLMPLYRKLDKWGYEMLQSNVGGKWCHTHRLVERESHNDGKRILKRRGLPAYMKLLKDPLLREAAFASPAPGNHKVVAVHLTGKYEDVYDITVDVTHNFALTSGVIVKNSTRDVAGIATDTYSPFISKREAIEDMFDPDRPHLFDVREWEMGRGLQIYWSKVMTENARGERVPWCCSHANRHVHIDLSKNMCATGLCIAHQAGMTEVVRIDIETGKKSIEEAAVFHVDGILRILAGPAGDIQHDEVRGLIYKLNEGGFNIRSVSMDHWMSVPNMQILKKHGFRVEEISTVKKIDPYDTTRAALYESRIQSPEYDILRQELRVLELDPRRPAHRPRVIVPPGHTKDVADAFSAAIYYLAKNAKGGLFLAPTHGVSQKTQTKKTTWKDGNAIWTDEEGYDAVPDPEFGGGSQDLHSQAWII